MTNYKKINKLMYLAQRAMDTGHHGRTEKLLRQLLMEAFKSKDNKIINEISAAFMEYRRLRALEVLKILKQIDPIQSLQKELS